ncbi:MAG: glycosyltransferase family 4 protein [Deltaproteobacteria bacterium]
MRVILSVDPVRWPLTGIGRYTYELSLRLPDIPEIEGIRFLKGGRLLNAVPYPAPGRDTHSRIPAWLKKSGLVVGLYRRMASRRKSNALKGSEDCVFHDPNYTLPPFGGRSVVTIHDISVFICPQCHPQRRVRYMQEVIPQSLRRATRVITVSEYVRREIASFWDWPIERIHVVHLACSRNFHPRDPEEIRPVLTRHGIPEGGYTLFVGTIEPRKNLLALLEAYSSLPSSVRRAWPLVLVGHRGWESTKIHERMAEAERKGWAIYLDYVAEEDLPFLYAGARLFVYPSLYEGFGLPVLEAMASGVPVVCSNTSALPEVAGDAALMCDPEDVEALARCVRSGLEDDIWRAFAVKKGLERAVRFSWERCARETAAVYQRALDSP